SIEQYVFALLSDCEGKIHKNLQFTAIFNKKSCLGNNHNEPFIMSGSFFTHYKKGPPISDSPFLIYITLTYFFFF
ncbi:MAG: hypothetical protein IKM57_06835, partial [Paludibacteraceae bacterium]|nr:hypothetical protein [Paludibacteraceae bacterium]